MTILKSKAFWAASSATGTIASAMFYDKHQTKQIRKTFLDEASLVGEAPLCDGEHERKITLMIFADTDEDLERQKRIFNTFSVDLLTKAGVDYQMIEVVGLNMDKKYYEVKKEQEISQVRNGEVVSKEDKVKPRIFSEDNFIKPMVSSWFNPSPTIDDPIKRSVFEEHAIKPLVPEFYSDGVVGLNPGTFRSMIWGFASGPTTVKPHFGLIKCEFPSSFLKSLYYRFNSREIADAVGRETMTVIRDRISQIRLNELLPSETTADISINIYK